MTKMIKLSLAAAMLTTTCSYAGMVTAPNSSNIELSGDVELKAVSEKTGDTTVQKRTAEVNLALEAKLASGTSFITEIQVYDDTQAGSNIENGTDLDVTKAYAVIPIMGGNGKVVAGLAPNNTYGTDAFDNGGESWKLAVNMPIARGVKVTVVSKVKNEEEKDSNKGDSGATALRVDAKVGEFMIGTKYGLAYANKGDGSSPAAASDKEIEKKILTGYIAGSAAGLDLGFEFETDDVKFIGTNQTTKPKGYYASVGKEIGAFSAGLAYVNLKDGMKGGDDFAPGMILDGNVDSSATEDTSAVVVPLEYAINDNLTAHATYIDAEVQGNDATEIDFGATYAMDDNIELSVGYGKYTIDNTDDQTNVEVAIALTF